MTEPWGTFMVSECDLGKNPGKETDREKSDR